MRLKLPSLAVEANRSTAQPQSTTNKAPAAPPARDGAAASSDEEEETKFNQPAPPENETEEELNERCKKIMNAVRPSFLAFDLTLMSRIAVTIV